MPGFRRHLVLKLVRGARAYLNLEAGVTRGALKETLGGGVDVGKMVWVFGTGRTGSTWLAAMIEELENQTVWFEPRVGTFFDATKIEQYGGGKHFIFAPQYRKVWLDSVRNFILDGANARFPEVSGGYLIVKEPGGSEGAPLIMQAMPESRMVLLIRDPRDVVASWMDAMRKDGWQNKRKGSPAGTSPVDTDPDAFVRRHAQAYLRNIGNARDAYNAHEGRKFVLKYEDLRVDTLETMHRMYSALGIAVDEKQLARAVEKHAWENIPQEEKGAGKFYRKGQAQGWREDLTPGQARTVERITGPLLEEFYPA